MLSSWDDLRFLEALERRGSARAAGRDLGVAPSTIYRRIAALERTTGFACLDRGRGITRAGRELAELARNTGASLEAIARRARSLREEVRGTLTLTTIDGFVPLLIEPLRELAIAHPELRIDVHVSERGGLSLRRRQAEIGISIVTDPPASLVARRLFPVRWAVYGTRAVVAAADEARWVTLARPHDVTWLGEWEAEHVPKTHVALASASRRLLVDLVASGVGLGLLPVKLAERVPNLVEVTSFRPRVEGLTRPAWLFTHAEVRADARVVAATKVLVKHLRA